MSTNNFGDMKGRIERIRELLPLDEILAQLAEEAAELSKAALKYRRAITGTNPTPVTREEARAALMEEAADVFQNIDVLGLLDDTDALMQMLRTQDTKYDRWIDRLEKGAGA